MAQVLVRNLDDRVVERLKEQAERRDVSLESLLRQILIDQAKPTMEEARERFQKILDTYGGRKLSDSAESIHEDRYG